ncbi:hypothetical protein TWF694_011829 [Orbilia ellipsospora]|uniref:Uncharacterized protein n=1 Tax=Orbilia ellipsospora TaxID=2528407 RepID=A0AAV9X6F8_9PEZI
MTSAFSPLIYWCPRHVIRRPSVRAFSSISHSDIPSFLRYAHISGLDPTKTVFTGTLYEYTVLSALTRLSGISLARVGGRDDAGVDLQGSWELPQMTTPSSPIKQQKAIKIPLIIQCKNVNEKSWKGPQYVRELDGALVSQPSDALGVLACPRDMTPGMKKQMFASKRALGFIKVTPLEGIYKIGEGELTSALLDTYLEGSGDGQGKHEFATFHLTGRGGLLQQFAWNQVAKRYLGRFGISARYVPKNYGARGVDLGEVATVFEDEALEQEIALTWNGIPMFKA